MRKTAVFLRIAEHIDNLIILFTVFNFQESKMFEELIRKKEAILHRTYQGERRICCNLLHLRQASVSPDFLSLFRLLFFFFLNKLQEKSSL